jgi:hypothetical protein
MDDALTDTVHFICDHDLPMSPYDLVASTVKSSQLESIDGKESTACGVIDTFGAAITTVLALLVEYDEQERVHAAVSFPLSNATLLPTLTYDFVASYVLK